MPRRAPAGRRDLGEVRALQRSRPGGFRIAALLRPPAPEAGEPEDVWLDRAAVARKQGAFGHHTHFGGVDRARPPVPELACDRLRREATWLSERGMGPRFWCGGGWYFTPAIAGVLSDLGYADKAGMVLTDSDGDQPGVIMNLYRFVQGIGCRPVLAGNIKGLHDPYRNPTTQEGFARKRGLTPHMATSFADGTKISFEMAIVANATGLRVAQRGMFGPYCDSVHDAVRLFPPEPLLEHGIVDYVVGAEPAPGVFVLGHQEHPVQRAYLDLYKLGEGPFYTFYRPYPPVSLRGSVDAGPGGPVRRRHGGAARGSGGRCRGDGEARPARRRGARRDRLVHDIRPCRRRGCRGARGSAADGPGGGGSTRTRRDTGRRAHIRRRGAARRAAMRSAASRAERSIRPVGGPAKLTHGRRTGVR